jgi:hypothetical protein
LHWVAELTQPYPTTAFHNIRWANGGFLRQPDLQAISDVS